MAGADMEFAQMVRQECPRCRGKLLWSRLGVALGTDAPQEVKDSFREAAEFFGVDLAAPGEPLLSAPVWWCPDCDNCGVMFADGGSVGGIG